MDDASEDITHGKNLIGCTLNVYVSFSDMMQGNNENIKKKIGIALISD